MNIYFFNLVIWIVLVITLFSLFRFLPEKMKSTENVRTKNSLFTTLMLTGIPLVLIVIIAPIIIIGGDENMPSSYKCYFGIVVLAAIVLFVFLKKGNRKN